MAKAKIVKTKNVLGGKPRIEGTRISVDLIGSYISVGCGVDQIRRDYPQLTNQQIGSALDYLTDQIGSERGKIGRATAQV